VPAAATSKPIAASQGGVRLDIAFQMAETLIIAEIQDLG
jgi:hypothetical protein